MEDLSCLRQLSEDDFFDDECSPTDTSDEQMRIEESVLHRLKNFEEFSDLEPGIHLKRQNHLPYLLKGLAHLSKGYQIWEVAHNYVNPKDTVLLYSLILNHGIVALYQVNIVDFLSKCQNPDGGYGGGPGQISHLAPTYAAVNCLCTLGTEKAYQSINREKLLYFLYQMRHPDGSFAMHEGGESDTRSLYCAVSVASLTGLLKNVEESLFLNSAQYVVSCQTYEGGIGGCPGTEAHGGYTFCGYAALVILGHEKLIDTDHLLRWLVNRQMRLEGGFQGRTNKLVDGCYSFWQGGVFPLIHTTILSEGSASLSSHKWLFDQKALQEYILISCQSRFGGLIDKPGKSSDYYHTCYCLSGLSIAQHLPDSSKSVLGESSNLLVATHPAYNVTFESVSKAQQYFQDMTLNLKCDEIPV